MKNKKKQIIVSIIAVLLLVLLTIGVTYAVFTYTKLGTTENTVTAGTLKFLYTENTGVGAGIALTDALPVSDTVGKSYSTEGKVFDFSIEATNTGTEVIPYEITLRKKNTSTLGEEAVKVYLTDMTEDADSEILEPTLYSNLKQTNIDVGDEIEKTIHTDSVAGGELTYLKDYRLRMWVAEETDFSSGNYNSKTFIATVNVYSNVPLVSEEEMNLRGNANISSVSVDGTAMTAVTGQKYQYESTLPLGTTEATINVETENPNSTVTIEKVDSIAYNGNNSNVEKMAVSKKVAALTGGNNYFKVTVTSQNKEVKKEYYIKISVEKALEGFAKKIYDSNTLITNTPNFKKTSQAAGENGLYKSIATNDGNPTYYFRGNVTNNYVDFAGFTWRIVRINEDGTIRIVMQNGINNNASYKFNTASNNKKYMYYSNSNAKTQLTTWYNTNIASNENYSSKVATGDYYCEQAKVGVDVIYTANSGANMALLSSYTPNFKCSTDANGYGLVNSNVGTLSYDEVAHAGGYYNENNNYYLNNGSNYWIISPAGFYSGSTTHVWFISSPGRIYFNNTTTNYLLRPVINLKADIVVTGLGTSDSHWVVQ